MAFRRVVNRSHISLQDVQEGFFRVSEAIELLAGPDRVQVVFVAFFEEFVDLLLLMHQFVQEEMVLREREEETVPAREEVALRAVQGRVHRHEVPELVVHHEGPRDEVVDVVLFREHGAAGEDVADFVQIKDALPEFADVAQFAHLFVHRGQFVDQAEDFGVVVLEPFDFFVLDPS